MACTTRTQIEPVEVEIYIKFVTRVLIHNNSTTGAYLSPGNIHFVISNMPRCVCSSLSNHYSSSFSTTATLFTRTQQRRPFFSSAWWPVAPVRSGPRPRKVLLLGSPPAGLRSSTAMATATGSARAQTLPHRTHISHVELWMTTTAAPRAARVRGGSGSHGFGRPVTCARRPGRRGGSACLLLRGVHR